MACHRMQPNFMKEILKYKFRNLCVDSADLTFFKLDYECFWTRTLLNGSLIFNQKKRKLIKNRNRTGPPQFLKLNRDFSNFATAPSF